MATTVSTNSKIALFGAASALALALTATPALAQTATPPQQPGSSTSQDDDATDSPAQDSDVQATAAEVASPLETGTGDNVIVVTGSRIARPEFSSPNPIQSFTTESLEQSGETNIVDFLLDTPALVGSQSLAQTSGSNGFFESAGLNLLDLRNLGEARTLVLVDGRRHVAAYPGSAAVDINTIPVDLIKSIDILTGGTSAIYGADGVSGVVNFVLRRDFEGIRARGQIGISEVGDAGNKFASLTAGQNFADGRGNIAVSYEFNENDRLNDKDRPFTGDPAQRFELLRVASPTDRPDDPNVFDRVLYNNVSWADSAPDGAVDLDLDYVPDFTGSGLPYQGGTFLPGTGGRAINGPSNTPTAGYFGDFLPYIRRHNVNLLASYEFTPALKLFAEAKYVDTTAFTISQPTFDFFTYLQPDNAFLRQRFGTVNTTNGAFVSRDNLDFGIRGDRSERETIRGVIGLNGDLTDHLRYEVSYVHGEVTNLTSSLNDRIADRYYAALDAVVNPATGQLTCRINLPGETIIDPINYAGVVRPVPGGPPVTGAPLTFQKGQCVPLNILGQANQAGLDFVLASHTNQSKIKQDVVSGYLSGDFGRLFELPGGPIGYALGAEYRKEQSSQNPSQIIQQGALLDSSQILPASGEFDVKEAFAELNVPLLKDMPFADQLSVGAAIRFSDYSTVGNTTTWKVDALYAPVRDLSFRGTYSQAVRAPNISELFDPTSGTFQFINPDPCAISNRTSGSPTRVANCVAQLTALGLTAAQIAVFEPSAAAATSKLGLVGGNANLSEEEARTWTAGAVIRPRFIPNLVISGDWYDIKIQNAISYPTATQLFALCVDQPTLQNVFCQNITRQPGTGFAQSFNVIPQNVAEFTTSGLDVQLNYRFSPSPQIGTFNIKVVGGYLDDLTFISTPGAVPDQDAGEQYVPRYIGVADLTWTKGGLSVNYGLAYQSKTRRFTTEQLAANPDLSDPQFFFFRERWEHDLQVSYTLPTDDFTLYAGVNNLTDEKPDVSSGGNYPYSAVGRYFYVGAKVKLGGLVRQLLN